MFQGKIIHDFVSTIEGAKKSSIIHLRKIETTVTGYIDALII